MERKYAVFEAELTDLLNMQKTLPDYQVLLPPLLRAHVHLVITAVLLQTSTGNPCTCSCSPFHCLLSNQTLNTLLQSNTACFSEAAYYKIQAAYLVVSARSVRQRCQNRQLTARREEAVKLAGDGGCDSPGHTAKYGSYTLMDAETSEAFHVEFLQVR